MFNEPDILCGIYILVSVIEMLGLPYPVMQLWLTSLRLGSVDTRSLWTPRGRQETVVRVFLSTSMTRSHQG